MVEPCDIILVGKGKPFTTIMGFFQDVLVEWGHAAIVGPNNTVYSLETKMQFMDLDVYLLKKKQYEIHRFNFMTPEKREHMIKVMRRFNDLSYGWTRLLLFLLNHVFGRKVFTSLNKNKLVQVCSSFVAWLYYVEFKIKFNGQEWHIVDPDGIDDHCSNSTEWTLVKRVTERE
jgi:hypothetical protein